MKLILGILFAPIVTIAGIKLAMHPERYGSYAEKHKRRRRGRRRRKW